MNYTQHIDIINADTCFFLVISAAGMTDLLELGRSAVQ